MDYTGYININLFDIYENMYSNILNEMSYYMDIYDSTEYILTEAETVSKIKDGLKEIVRKVKEFFENIFRRFKENIEKLLRSSSVEKIKSVDKDTAKSQASSIESIKIIPYWLMDNNKTKSTIQNVLSKMRTICTGNKSTGEMFNEITESIVNEFKDEKGNFKEGVKNYFRVGKSKGPIEKVTISGQELLKKTEDFYDFVVGYAKNPNAATGIPEIQALFRSNDITFYENVIVRKLMSNNTATKESFIDEELYSIIIEQEDKTDTKVEIEKKENKENDKKDDKPDNISKEDKREIILKNPSGASLLNLIALVLEVFYSAYVTVFNEKLYTYTKVLSFILKYYHL